MNPRIKTYGKQAVLLQFPDQISEEIHLWVKTYYKELKELDITGVLGFIPAYNSLTIQYDVDIISFENIKKIVTDLKPNRLSFSESDIVTIPVCYEKEFALDMEWVCEYTKLSREQVIEKHSAQPYLVYMLGFTPGFMYLGGLDAQLHVPRKETPRLKIEKGSVGLANQQTGIYPQTTPGGWQIIGRTPLDLFTLEKGSLVKMGDRVRFEPISKQEYDTILKI